MDERWREEGDAITWRGQKADTFDIDGVGGPRSAAPSSARDRPFSPSHRRSTRPVFLFLGPRSLSSIPQPTSRLPTSSSGSAARLSLSSDSTPLHPPCSPPEGRPPSTPGSPAGASSTGSACSGVHPYSGTNLRPSSGPSGPAPGRTAFYHRCVATSSSAPRASLSDVPTVYVCACRHARDPPMSFSLQIRKRGTRRRGLRSHPSSTRSSSTLR